MDQEKIIKLAKNKSAEEINYMYEHFLKRLIDIVRDCPEMPRIF